MFTIKLIRFADCANVKEGYDGPRLVDLTTMRETKAVHVRRSAEQGIMEIQLGDAPGETEEVTVGSRDCMYHLAYVMNDEGRTVETVR